jgi:hypothetical protein
MWGTTTARVGAAIAGIIIASAATTASAAPWSQAGGWSFNEGPNASTASDNSGNGLDAAVGDDVRTGMIFNNRTYYNFPADGAWGGPNHERLVLVPDTPELDPGVGIYRVAIAIRTRAAGVNILQKGQSNTYGGFWKIETHNGLATCLFRGSNDESSGVGSGQRVDDGKWHRIVCTRFPDRVVMRVDGEVTDTRYHASGSVSNSKYLAIGGKPECGGSVGCDYYIGDIDYVRISTR